MKKYLLFFMAAMMLFPSCQGPAGRDGVDGEGINWFVRDYTINSSDWQLVGGTDELNSYWQAEISVSELTKFVYESGNVFCYMYQKDDNNNEVQTMLPFTVPKGSNSGGTEELWTETYACDFMPGSIMFYVNYSDFYTNNRPPATSFRVVLNW